MTKNPQTPSSRIEERLGLRLVEFSRAVGISLPTLWRRVRAGDIRVTYVGQIPIITRHELARLGLINSNPSS
jgi:hypothetical protein